MHHTILQLIRIFHVYLHLVISLCLILSDIPVRRIIYIFNLEGLSVILLARCSWDILLIDCLIHQGLFLISFMGLHIQIKVICACYLRIASELLVVGMLQLILHFNTEREDGQVYACNICYYSFFKYKNSEINYWASFYRICCKLRFGVQILAKSLTSSTFSCRSFSDEQMSKWDSTRRSNHQELKKCYNLCVNESFIGRNQMSLHLLISLHKNYVDYFFTFRASAL